MSIPIELWGKDHWSTFAYIEARIVACYPAKLGTKMPAGWVEDTDMINAKFNGVEVPSNTRFYRVPARGLWILLTALWHAPGCEHEEHKNRCACMLTVKKSNSDAFDPSDVPFVLKQLYTPHGDRLRIGSVAHSVDDGGMPVYQAHYEVTDKE